MSKIMPSVGIFIGCEQDVVYLKEATNHLGMNVHLSFYERESYDKYKYACADVAKYVTSVHLPKGLAVSEYSKSGLVGEARGLFNVDLFNVHPWSRDLPTIVSVVKQEGYTLCLEAFKKGQGSPFWLLETFGEELRQDHLGLCMDYSHLELELANYSFLKNMLPYTKMIHASNRMKNNQHLPVFHQGCDTNAQSYVSQLLDVKDFPVREIVLEYMSEYRDKLVKQFAWLNTIILQKRRRYESRKV